MRREALFLAPVAFLAACDARPDPDPADDAKTVHVAADGANGVSVRVPGVDASLSLPGLDLSRHVDLDGIKLAPGTRVRTLDVTGRDGPGGGTLDLTFADPRGPAALIAYYRDAATRAGFGAARATTGALSADKNGRQFALTVGADGTGSAGTIRITGP